ncbi:hypothetical protein ACHAPT_011247 [Fusarium lateritium]
MDGSAAEGSPTSDTHVSTKHEDRIAWLNQKWEGPTWLPQDVRDAVIDRSSPEPEPVYYMVEITRIALQRQIPLRCLWDAESPHGHLRKAVMKGSQPPLLTADIAKDVYDTLEASEPGTQDHTPSEHLSSEALSDDDEDSIEFPSEEPATTGSPMQLRSKTKYELCPKRRPAEHQDGSLTENSHVRHDDQPTHPKRSHRGTSRGSVDITAFQYSIATGSKVVGVKDVIHQSGQTRDPTQLWAPMNLSGLSSPPELHVSPDGLLQPTPSFMQTSTQSLLPNFPRFPSPPAAGSYSAPIPVPSSPKTPNKKRKRDRASMAPVPTRSVKSESPTGPLTADKIIRQLTCDVQLTDDIVELICQAIVVEHADENVRLLNPLWFRVDDENDLPQKHWTMGVARVLSTGVTLHFHDAVLGNARADVVERRFQAWMNRFGLTQPLVFTRMKCTAQRDGTSCGIHAAVCLRRDLLQESCTTPIEPWSEKREMLKGLRTVREASPIQSSTFPHLRELRSRQSVGADALSAFSTPRGSSAILIQSSQQPDVQVTQPEAGLGSLLDALSLETLQHRLKSAEIRLEAAINARDEAQETLQDLEIKQNAIHEMYPRIVQTIRSRGITMDEYDDATMAAPKRNMMVTPETSTQDQILLQRGNYFGDLLTTSYREGVDHSLAALRESQALVGTEIGNTRGIISLRNEEITSVEDEVASLQEVCRLKKGLERYSRPEWMDFFRSMQDS